MSQPIPKPDATSSNVSKGRIVALTVVTTVPVSTPQRNTPNAVFPISLGVCRLGPIECGSPRLRRRISATPRTKAPVSMIPSLAGVVTGNQEPSVPAAANIARLASRKPELKTTKSNRRREGWRELWLTDGPNWPVKERPQGLASCVAPARNPSTTTSPLAKSISITRPPRSLSNSMCWQSNNWALMTDTPYTSPA